VKIPVPALSLVVLIGPSGSGKSTFARRHFAATEILSSDFCRGLVSDDENDQAATVDAFETLQFIAGKRLKAGKLTVIDATNVQPEARKPLVALAKAHDVLPVAIVLDLPQRLCHDRNAGRDDRKFGPHVIRGQVSNLRRSLKALGKEGFRHVFVLNSAEEVEGVSITREKLWNDRRDERGPFDIIGDVHGCADELELLLAKLGYELTSAGYAHPAGRKAVFLGDLVDRGPRVLDTLRIASMMVHSGTALCVPGNHDDKFRRKLLGKQVHITHGLEQTLAELEALPEEQRKATTEELISFLDSLIGHYVLDGGRLVVAHAGMKAEYQGRASGRVREFALYGETTGETDEFGLPVRHNWAAEYRGPAMVVYGHTPVPEPEWINHTVNIDTGCVFGGKLTALRYPEREFVSVSAAREYAVSVKPFLAGAAAAGSELSAQQELDDVLDYEDVSGKRIIATRLAGNVTIREENSLAALELMSRFAVNPKWLIYLPPTMSPTETTSLENYLEHPAEAFRYFRDNGVDRVICQEKHMGSRAVVIVCRDEDVARQRFGARGEGAGICYTRTGRKFFDNTAVDAELLAILRNAMDGAGWWEKFQSDWFCLDCELMPWSAKAQELLRRQYAPVGTAAGHGLSATIDALQGALQMAGDSVKPALQTMLETHEQRLVQSQDYISAYRRYCWKVDSVADLRLAPFHLLASEGKVHSDQNHRWHLETLAELAVAGSKLLATRNLAVDLTSDESTTSAICWWEELTAAGGEGMVVKPLDWIHRASRGLVQPAVKCRGREYLRIIYGPEYDSPQHLSRLRQRSVAAKRGLALREFALGLEGLDRFIRREPLRKVHECVFGVLALESEPVDPRL
jgi:protein phosphatase